MTTEFSLTELYTLIVLAAVLFFGLRFTDWFFVRFARSHQGSAYIGFLKGCVKAFIIGFVVLTAISMIPFVRNFTSQILMSSSLIVVVLGFVFQESLANMVHGLIISVSQPYRVGDRVKVSVNGKDVDGYVQKLEMRHTVIRDITTAVDVMVPNAAMDTNVIINVTRHKEAQIRDVYVIDHVLLTVTYESNLEKALTLTGEVIDAHPAVRHAREELENHVNTLVTVQELGADGITIRGSVVTLTPDENFIALSDIRRELKRRVDADPDIWFAYPHVQIIGD